MHHIPSEAKDVHPEFKIEILFIFQVIHYLNLISLMSAQNTVDFTRSQPILFFASLLLSV